MNIVVLVSGRGSNLQAIIDAVRDGDIKSRIIRVISDNPAAPALERARFAGIDTLVIAGKNRPKKEFFVTVQPDRQTARNKTLTNSVGMNSYQPGRMAGPILRPKAKNVGEQLQFFFELDTELQRLNPELIVLAGFMRILPAEIVRHFKGRIINIHPSLLPAFPGLNAQLQALTAGVPFTGCTVHFVDEGCDTGPIILQRHVTITPGDTVETLSERLLIEEHRALVDAIRRIEVGAVGAGRL